MSYKLLTLDTWTTCMFIWKILKSKQFLLDRYLIFSFVKLCAKYQFYDEMSLGTWTENLLILSLERPRSFWEKIHAKHFGRFCKPFSFVKSHKKLCEQTLNQLWKIIEKSKKLSHLCFYTFISADFIWSQGR